jgi:hyaluronan synthase/N-acetylglucosaminyltransferase
LTDPAIGAATGDVRIFNSTVNLLTRMQSLRYWLAFHLERAAQSYAHCMLCCSGPFSAYKANLIKQIQDKYIHQTFLNHPCTYGDDRHLTNLVINHGYKTIFQPHAIAYTFAPTQFTQFIQQQVRWSKSFFRETVWTLKNYRQFSFYSLWDLVLQNLLTLTFIFTLSLTAFETLNTLSASPLLQLLITLLAMASLRALYALLNTRNLWFLIFPSYSFLHLTTLIPIRLKALFTLADSSWGTRSSSQKGPWIDHCKWIAIYLILILNITGLLVLTTENQILSNLTQTTFSLSQHFTFPIQTYPNLLLSIAALTSAVLVITHHQTTNPHTQPVQKRHE